MKKREEKKKGQFQLSFGVIFSIILIIFFVVMAIYVIIKIIGIQCTIQGGKFKDDFQREVNRIWASDVGEDSYRDYMLGTIGKNCLEYVCFYNGGQLKGIFKEQYDEIKDFYIEGNNLYFYPVKKSGAMSFKIDNLNNENFKSNPFCFKVEKNRVRISLKKSESDALVSLGN